jgi:diguanylate cyclase (GGDEF)-like protein
LRLSRSLGDALLAGALGAGSPAGLLALRGIRAGRLDAAWVAEELSANATTYAYLLLSTTAVFAGFAFVLGRQADRLERLSRTDPLTGLGNRRHVEERLAAELARARRHGVELSLLVLDLDGLKAVNDRHGHKAGDAALRRVAAAIAQSSRASDVAGRWGGDEFVVLAPDTASEDAAALAERIRRLAREAAGGEEAAPPLSVSIGVASLAPADDPEGLLRRADAALLEAKHQGGDRVVAA